MRLGGTAKCTKTNLKGNYGLLALARMGLADLQNMPR